MNPTTGTTATPAAPAQAGGPVAGPLIDKAGRTFEQCRALGLRVINRLHPVTKHFMPKGGRKPGSKTKPKMENPTTATATAQSNAESGAAGSPPPAAQTPASPGPAPEQQAEIPGMAELKAALAEAPTAEAEAGPVALKNADEYTRAAAGTVSMISTAAILAMGAHVKPTDEQVSAMVEAYASSFRHYGYKPEPPPWLGPVIATAVWVGPHFADERSQSNLQRWKQKAVNAWLWIRGKIDGRAAANSAAAANR